MFVWFLYWIQADIDSLLLNLTHAMLTKLSCSHSNYALQKNQNVHVTYVIQQQCVYVYSARVGMCVCVRVRVYMCIVLVCACVCVRVYMCIVLVCV